MGIAVFIFGLLIGSFVNVLIDRLPHGESVVWGRSHCDHCKKTLRWFELIPVISFAWQKGRCLRCHNPLSFQYPIVEVVSAAGFVYLFFHFPSSIPLFLSCSLLFFSLLVIFVADLKYQIIPDSMLVTSGVAILWYWWATHVSVILLLSYLLTALVSFAAFYLLWAVTRGRGLGFGDVKFVPLMGAFLGFPGVVIALYIAFLTGAMVGVILMLGRQKNWKSKIAFGPFLVFGMVAAWVWHGPLLTVWRMYI